MPENTQFERDLARFRVDKRFSKKQESGEGDFDSEKLVAWIQSHPWQMGAFVVDNFGSMEAFKKAVEENAGKRIDEMRDNETKDPAA